MIISFSFGDFDAHVYNPVNKNEAELTSWIVASLVPTEPESGALNTR